MNRGKWVILAILGVAMSLSGFSVWYLHRQSRRAAEFWGSEVFQQICHAPRIELMRLKPAESGSETEVIGGRKYTIDRSRDITEVHGHILLRESLAEDNSFDWNKPPPPAGDWQYLLRFSNPEHASAEVAVSINRALAGDPARGTAVSIEPIAERLKVFFEEQFKETNP